jgi:signal transduction histidine kinase
LGIFSLLLFANTVVYGAYVGGGKGSKHVFLALILSILFLLGVVLPGTTLAADSQRLFNRALVAGPLLGMLFLTVLSVAMISWLRSEEHRSMEDRLNLIGRYEAMLSGSVVVGLPEDRRPAHGNRFWEIVPEVIKDLCSQRPTYWYRGGCLWLVVSHRDFGEIVVPGPNFNADLPLSQWMRVEDLPDLPEGASVLVPGDHAHRFELYAGGIRPVIVVPMGRGERKIGYLTLYGDSRPPLLQSQERAFLQSLGSIISNTMEQWDGRYREYPRRAMDDLFKCRDLDEVFKGAAKVMQDFLMASGCMVVFRDRSGSADMKIVAAEGFSASIYGNSYRVGEGKTGECALEGKTLRYDDARGHGSEFNNELFANLQTSHGREIRSWMAMPIGPSDRNFGVIKVVNSKSWCGWFTDELQGLGEDLALRLNVIIEKFLYIRATEEARDEAQRFAVEAMSAKQGALTTAEKREEDLMTMTHQLLGPLSSVVGSITNLQERQAGLGSTEALDNVRALVEDAITLCYGTFTTFAHSLGKGPAFLPTNINAQDELKGLWRRLQMTSGGRDLHFVYREESGFPQLWIDRNVFISVMYSLFHNALKYADAHSTVFLECSFERGGRAAIKVKSIGEPIQPHEASTIFQKFGRGHLVKSTGRYHAGVGLAYGSRGD